MTGIDLSKIPPPDALVEVDHAAMVARMKDQVVLARPDLAPVLALASEPMVKLIESWAYELMLARSEFNAGIRGVLLASATGADLDNIAANLLVERRAGEDHETFRARAALGPEGWSTAGPHQAYLYHALSASAEVADVAVSSPEPGDVRVVILSTAPDGVASAELLATVAQALNADEVRPLTDHVVVTSAAVADYDVTAVIKVRAGPDADPVRASAEAAVRIYGAERRRLGRGVALAGLTAALMQPGSEDVDLIAPLADIAATPEAAPVLGVVTLTVEVVA